MKWNNSISKWNRLPTIPGGICASPGTVPPVVLPPGIVHKNILKLEHNINFLYLESVSTHIFNFYYY